MPPSIASLQCLSNGFKRTQLEVDAGGLLCAFDADVDICRGFRGNDVGARSARNHAGIDGDSLRKSLSFAITVS
jgi:hypothetical protein